MTRRRLAGSLILTEVYCHEYLPSEDASYIRMDNQGSAPVALSGWALEWGGAVLQFPAGRTLPPGNAAYVAWNAGRFQEAVTRLPDYTVQPSAGVPSLLIPGGAPAPLAPNRGSVRLLSPDGAVADAFVWGDAAAPREWAGPGAALVDAGQVYQRAVDEASLGTAGPGRFVAPGGTAAAWRQGSDWLPRRQMRLGQGGFPYPTWAAASATVFAAPDGAFAAVQRFLAAAGQQLDINMYLFTNPKVATLIEAALQRGVRVRLLFEAEPFKGISQPEHALLARLQAAGVEVRGLHAAADGFKRYHFDHAKYAVADGQRSLIMSFNWVHATMPDANQSGERGWGAVVESAPLADYLTRVFDFDWNTRSPDSIGFHPDTMAPTFIPAPEPEPAPPQTDPIAPATMKGTINVTPFLAPEHALLENHATSGLLRGAGHTLDIQQDTVELYWEYDQKGSLASTPNLLLNEVVAAARRGVRVRLLLSGGFHDPQNPRDNAHTQKWLTALAGQEHLALEARLLDPARVHIGLHNMGLIADGQRVLISSINWTENSSLNNRELGLILDSAEVAGYFGKLFERDWAGGTP